MRPLVSIYAEQYDQKNNILPAKKPIVIVEKTYENVSELEPAKKKWLLDTAVHI